MKQLSSFPPADVQSARERVAQDWEDLHHAIHKDDDYAPHVTESTKRGNLLNGITQAGAIRRGESDGNFTIWQRIYAELTGQCIAFLP